MNATQQRQRHSAVANLASDFETVIEGMEAAIKKQFLVEREATAKAIGDERTYRLRLAEEQRSYVDGADRDLARKLTLATEPLRRSFFGRLKWLVRGV